MSTNFRRGVVLVPALIIGALVVMLGGVLIWQYGPDPSPVEVATSTIDTTTTKRQPLPVFKQTAWRGGALNTTVGSFSGHQIARKTVYVGPGLATFKVEIDNPQAKVSLVAPDGTEVTPVTAATNAQVTYRTETSADGKKAVITYQVANNKQSGAWTVTIENADNSSATATTNNQTNNYSVTTPNAPEPLSVSDNTVDVVSNTQGVILGLTVEETISSPSGLVVQTVSGAVVVATITDPTGDVSVVQLTESPTTPGTYTGTYTGNQELGTYLVEYTITGQSATGQQFEQTTYSDFTVTTEPNLTDTGSGWYKKYDINRSNQVRILNY